MTLDNLRYALILSNKALLGRLKPFIHKHDNLSTLNGLGTDDKDHLLFNGNLVNEQYEVSDDEIEKIVNEVMSELDKTLGNDSTDNSESGGNKDDTDNPEDKDSSGSSTGNKWTTSGLGDKTDLNDRFDNFGKDKDTENEDEQGNDGSGN